MELVGSVLPDRKAEPAAFSKSESETFHLKAAVGIKELQVLRQKVRNDLLERAGGRVVVDIVGKTEAFRVQRFDPINLMVLDAGETAHANFVSLAGPRGSIELTNPRFVRGTLGGSVAITIPAGQHPLADGIRQLTIVGIDGTPKVVRDGETITLEAPGVRLMLRGVEATVDGEAVRITVKKSSSG